MKINEIKQILKTSEYTFLREHKNLGNNILLLGLGGSHAYGLEKETSDLDIRGIAFNPREDILLGNDFEQVVNSETDTTIYSFNKMMNLLSEMNPNTIEILGLEPWQYLYLHPVAIELLDNKDMFLSKICIQKFAGYAGSQLRRLENKSVRSVEQSRQEEHILNSIKNAEYDFKREYQEYNDMQLRLYIDESSQPLYDTEIFMDINLTHYPLRDYCGLWNRLKSIVSSYAKMGKRNENAISHNKLGKHMACLIRLYMMCIDILIKHEIITYRRDEHDLLMEIRNGDNKWLDKDSQPTKDFYDLLNEYQVKLNEAVKVTTIPDLPDYKRITNFKMSVNERIVRGDI